ncbi:hypothetical protein KFE25_009839 [Diacronema lutheri]|uniref:FAD dependent oxidoreductase domain-containing protein n=2 Tax=Diacronema lutheri TaxID=2081491 RepID=A0A8J6BZE5_DIALT|nr:hypothetical protein KFE25_009839 [Diacronema lutheri]
MLLCTMAAAHAPSATTPQPRVVIAGAGLQGAALAYYLTQRGVRPLIVEADRVAGAASGKGGGFLARDWGSGPTVQLHKLGFRLHAELAESLGIASYRRLPVLRVTPGPRTARTVDICPWLDGEYVSNSDFMDKLGGAQVSPRELCEALVDRAVSAGAILRRGSVTGIVTDKAAFAAAPGAADGVARADARHGDGGEAGARARVTAVLVDGEAVPCSHFAVCMGPWAACAAEWFGCPLPMTGIKSTSVIFHPDPHHLPRPDPPGAAGASVQAAAATAASAAAADAGATAGEPRVVQPFALFCGEDERHGTHLEVYPRANGDVYVCGIGGSEYVQGDELVAGRYPPGQVEADPSRVDAAVLALSSLSRTIAQKPPIASQACMRPCPPDALPLMGRVPTVDGAFVSAGHNCWGILWAPASGLAMSELIIDGEASSLDLRPFDPARFAPARTANAGRAAKRGRKQGQAAVGEQW